MKTLIERLNSNKEEYSRVHSHLIRRIDALKFHLNNERITHEFEIMELEFKLSELKNSYDLNDIYTAKRTV